jgi:predicted metal-binding membrane protein
MLTHPRHFGHGPARRRTPAAEPAPHSPAGAAPGARGRLREGVFVLVLLALAALAWLAVHWLAMPDMEAGILTGGAERSGDGMAGMPMEPSVGAGLFLGTWLVMMAAMMLPAVTPVIVRIDRMMRRRGGRATTAYLLAAGYLAVWGAAGVAAYGLFLVLQPLAAAGDAAVAVRAGAVVLLFAGAYQLSPLKRACLRLCRSPLAVVVRHGERIAAGPRGAVIAGLHHGAFCLGCCWALMAVLLAAGVMSLVWMGVVAAVILAEKVWRHGEALSRPVGAAMIVFGLVLLAAPGAAPTLT